MRIGHRDISPNHSPYIIAELGVNHDGSVDRALQLVDAAALAGADAIKLQLFRADLLMSKAARLAAYQKAAGEQDPIDMLRRLELSIHQMGPIVKRARLRNIQTIVTVFSQELIAEAELLPWDAYKTASPDLVHRPLLESLVRTGRPLIVSTGAAEMREVREALAWLAPAKDRLALLQCVSCYPTAPDDAAVGGVIALAEAFAGPVGYSDHTTGLDAAQDAVKLGACVLEKHLTYDRYAQGPDHSASLDAAGLTDYCQAVRRTWLDSQDSPPLDSPPQNSPPDDPPTRRWPAIKQVGACEADVRAVSRQSITTRADLSAGHILTRDDLTFKRPGTGLLPYTLASVLGSTLARSVEADMPLMAADLVAMPSPR